MQMLYPWFLVGLIAIAIPIIVHLLQLRRPQRVVFTNNSFIREVELVAVRHRKVQQLLILLSRILLISALVVAFSQPFVSLKGFGNASNIDRVVNVLIDNSFSMQLQGASQNSLFEAAIAGARGIGESLPATGKVRLVGQGRRIFNKAVYQASWMN